MHSSEITFASTFGGDIFLAGLAATCVSSSNISSGRETTTGPGVLEQIPAIIAELDIPERGLIVCDKNTLEIAGNQVIEYLEAGGHPMQKIEVSGANIKELERVESYSEEIDFLVGVGGGRPIDLAKQAGFNKDIPFISLIDLQEIKLVFIFLNFINSSTIFSC